MSEWQRVKFEDLLVGKKISYGVVQPGQFQEVGGIPLIRVNNIKNAKVDVSDIVKIHHDVEAKYSKTRLCGGELLITVVGSVGECAIVSEDLKGFNVARAVSVANIIDGIDKRFVAYQFRTEDLKFQMYGNTNDTVQPTLNLAELKQLNFILPSLPEQKVIASVLSSLDDKIDLLNRQNKTLEEMAEVLFHQWFIEEVNENWKVGALEDLIDLKYGKALKQENRSGSGYPVVASSGVVGFHNEYLVEGPGIVIGRKGTLGKVYFMEDNFFPIDTSYFIKTKIPESNLIFEYYLLKTLDFANMNSDSAVPGLNRNLALGTTIQIPPLKRIVEFNTLAKPGFSKIYMNTKQIQTLKKLRDTLLPKLMSGEVRVEYKKVDAA